MKATFTFDQNEQSTLYHILETNPYNPYTHYSKFKEYVATSIRCLELPVSLHNIASTIQTQRAENGIHVHLLANCPIDLILPELDLNNPVENKYKEKQTFISECFMECMAQILGTPLFSYKDRNNGDFFTDLVSFNKFKGKSTGFTEGDLIYHCDRSYHNIRADYVSLLGLKVSDEQLIYTNYIDVNSLKKHLDRESINILSRPIFKTEVDDYSKENNQHWYNSILHPIFLDKNLIRYQDTFTKPSNHNDLVAIKALLELKDAISKADKLHHRIKKGELLIFGNQTGIHNREWIDVTDVEEANKRWLLKTYSFKSNQQAEEYRPWNHAQNTLCV